MSAIYQQRDAAVAAWQLEREKVVVLAAQLQAAQAAIAEAKERLEHVMHPDTTRCYVCAAEEVLSRADTSALAEHDKHVGAKALKDAADDAAEAWVNGTWHLTVETASWLRTRAASIEQTEAE